MNKIINPNPDIEEMLKHGQARKWQVANALGISETSLDRWLHKPLNNERKQKIVAAITSINKQLKEGEVVK